MGETVTAANAKFWDTWEEINKEEMEDEKEELEKQVSRPLGEIIGEVYWKKLKVPLAENRSFKIQQSKG